LLSDLLKSASAEHLWAKMPLPEQEEGLAQVCLSGEMQRKGAAKHVSYQKDTEALFH
jgi:hypothetical protein